MTRFGASDLIIKKRDGFPLTEEEIKFLVDGFLAEEIPDYQLSAFLMAVFFQGLEYQETVSLTKVMIDSGESVDFSSFNKKVVDKHSSGGVGDKTTLALIPLVAAAGIPVAKMSGRGLGHTGGTIDKLSAIPGFNTEMPIASFIKQIKEIGAAVISQTHDLTPADKVLYQLRDVTGTVENTSLIASSIISKKIAAGAKGIVLDVKWGSGAFMKNKDDAFQLGTEMVNVAKYFNRDCVAVITSMEQPLGKAVGNNLEFIEAIDTLRGRGPGDLEELCIFLGGMMVFLGGECSNIQEGSKIISEMIYSGKGYDKLLELIQAQGGTIDIINDTSLMKKAAKKVSILSSANGFIKEIKALDIGLSTMYMGAGRTTKEDEIDLTAGIVLNKKIGDRVKEGELLADIYFNNDTNLPKAKKLASEAFQITSNDVIIPPLISGYYYENKKILF